MKNHTKIGKVIYWLGFLVFMFGIMFNEHIGILGEESSEFSSYSIPAIIIGIVLIVITNFFKKSSGNR
ncbi:hypothetical protein [Bacillus sp. AK128]